MSVAVRGAERSLADGEADLVAAARRGDEAAIRELIRRLNPRLFRVARGIVASDAEAEEVVQDTYLAAFTRLDRFEGRARFSTWVTRIAINTARMHLRRARPAEDYDTVTEDRNRRIVAFPGGPPETADCALGRAQVRALLETAIAGLPPELRLPFLLHEVEGMKLREIARALSVNPVTLRTRMFRARRQLRAALAEQVSGGFEAVFPFGGARCARMADRVIAALRAGRRR
ncbi:RNA polymerase sigma factor [Rhodobacteraceae bacterium 2CG4]|uniref:RNA polymerase sigma factor n=1 Tax=Halovulum marinum TaxID=2662447 RepID=A0A6L5Z3C3_9RHOB|nr:RNA polymerase sigma factor [Halovulum marinum]MSU91027.1 RNA polymerase sigma factor [Halovulum marinum]